MENAEQLLDKWSREYLSGTRIPQAEEVRLNSSVPDAMSCCLGMDR